MPYFSWRGVDMYGRDKKGTTFARSVHELDSRLFSRNIALLQAKPTRVFSLFTAVSRAHMRDFFQQLAQLLKAGVLLPDALGIVADQQHHGSFQMSIYALAQAVKEGHALHTALKLYPKQFDTLMVHCAQVGHESGTLAVALQALGEYLHEQETFYARMRAALLMPGITFLFFIGVLGVVLFGIMPQFSTLFVSLGTQMPATTQAVIALHTWLSGTRVGIGMIGIVVLGLLVRQYMRTSHGRARIDALVLKVPAVGNMVQQRSTAHFLRALALLLDGGMPLASALSVARGVVTNAVLVGQLDELVAEVAAGKSLAEACIVVDSQLFGPDVVALITVGQETGKLSLFCARAAILVQDRVQRSLMYIATVVQPLVLIVLGLLIALLLVSVYMPILTMAQSI